MPGSREVQSIEKMPILLLLVLEIFSMHGYVIIDCASVGIVFFYLFILVDNIEN